MTASGTAFTPLSITLFGPMQVLIQGEPLPHLRSRKAIWLMALLTLRHRQPVEREWLAGILWPDIPQHLAFANLRPIISELRRALQDQAERLRSPNRHTLRLEITEADADVLAFDASIANGTPAALERAIALYQGPLLEGCTEEWVWQERSQREQHCLQALQKLANAALTRRDYGAATGYYSRAVSIAPLWDAAQRGLMEAFAKMGDRNAALQVYRDFINLLKNDPKAVPDESTTALYLQLRNELRQQATVSSMATIPTREKALTSVRVGYLPQPLTGLIGREDERLEVITRLRKSRLLTLTGPGGIGKTRLAMEVATELTREYSEGVWYVGLESLSSGERIVPYIANLLGLRDESERSLLETLTTYLNRKRLLLVLDNCEHLVEACAEIASHLLRECAAIRILTTSREPLRITGEVAWTVPALAVPDPKHLPQGQTTLYRVLQGYESIQLFIERAQAVQSSFAMTKNNALAVGNICARLEGIPLAIELAAARIKAMTVEQIATQLDNHLGLLTTGSRIALVRRQTLRGTLDWTSALLSESERILLRRLSVFTGGWSLAAAEQICAGEGIEAESIASLLESLVEKSLVIYEEKESIGRYRLLETIRQYAMERLQVSGEAERVKKKHHDWLCAAGGPCCT